MFKKLRWDDYWQILLYTICILVVTLVSTCSLSKKYVKAYSLDHIEGTLTIIKEIEWSEDSHIRLDRNVSYWDAIAMVDSLNATLKRSDK